MPAGVHRALDENDRVGPGRPVLVVENVGEHVIL